MASQPKGRRSPVNISSGFTVFVIVICSFAIHESGHFFAARAADVRVERFSLGWGSSVLSTQLGETEFAIAAIPLGAEVKLFSDSLNLTAKQEAMLRESPILPFDIATVRAKDPRAAYELENFSRSFARQDRSVQALIMIAGPLANFFIAILATLIAIFVPARSETTRADDKLRPRPFMSDEPDQAFIDALRLPLLFAQRKVKSQDLSGPLGVLAEGLRMCGQGLRSTLVFFSSFNLAMAIFNVIPLAPLDGGKLFVLLLESLVGSLSFIARSNIEAIGAWTVMAVMLLLIVNDVRGRSR